ncbi:ectoine/hydroxyectoine ABC transporter substrate-binding protein EhuB [Pseudonocardia asaccharolytica]|uniref:Ectoine/hydroxyectoine ABC transporter substrate-binding protein EhuB n=1 Tax=Pseudonocardia asaccharolytica DSM 44247 = NBRC 16224 TaxID=1123024 RepID=A0A511D2E3_9PSEU|nr:ectoine/hydroxyectoine ABC transporter substrate-binding protein EhuB [Pseudonocardia asaccharolytica]GEL18955.1 ectoine/hydroxyectoine ABC transporter substrate-binding protein EhuB [Pseudonocardia asaccharolytica DSM 44247 = NBRC 16224]
MTERMWSRREFFRRTAVAGAVALGGPVLLSACTSTGGGGNALENARNAGTIKIGIAGEAPYGFTDASGRVTGEAPEVARAALQQIGIGEVGAEQVEFGSLIPALNANRYDMVCAGMNITPARCQQAAFSIPDYSALTAFLVPTGNPQGVKTFEDIAAKNLQLAVLGAAVEQGYAEKSGVPSGSIQVFPDQNALLQAVTDNRVYAAALTDISLKWLVKQNPNAPVEVTDGFAPVIDGKEVVSAGGFVFRQADNQLREAFNGALRTLHTNGEWVRIASPFGFSEQNLPAAELTTEQLCAA